MAKTKTTPNKNSLTAKPLALALEQRFMFDAAGVATGAEIAQDVAAKQAADQASENDNAAAAVATSEKDSRKEVVLIDANVSQRDVLVAGIPDNAEIVYLESGANLNDIANILSGYQNIDGLHIISHGGDSSLNLSGQTITSSNLADNKAALSIIGQALSADGDILLYGCNIGAEGSGQDFLDDFAEYTGADIAASDDLTGAAALGGDWDLETHVGLVDSRVIVDSTTVQNYASVLAISNENFDSVGLVNVIASSQTIGDWTFSLDVTDLIATPNSAEQAQNLNSDGGAGDRSLVVNNASVAFRTLTIESADGSEFDLSSIAFGLVNGGTATGVSIEGFRDNVSVVSSESVNITTSDTAGNIHYSFTGTTAGGSYGTLSFQSAFDNVDEIRITANNIAIMEVDDIVATAAVSNTAPDLGGTPADDTATEDVATAIDLSAYDISDANGDTITLTLAVDRGTIASTDGNGTTAGVTVATSGTSSMTLQGSVADLNTYLNDTSKITYTTASDDTTAATLTVTPNDGTVNGTADTVGITISAVNDNPTVLGVPLDVTVTEDTQSNIDFSGISFDDIDSASITVTLTANAGTFATPADGSGISVTESLTNSNRTITLVGSPANINTYLDTASNIQYTAAADVSGDNVATITVTANDGDGSGDVNLGTVNIDVTAVNDAPTVSSLPSSVTVTEDTQSNVDLSATVFADVDGDTINVTLTASAGTFATPADGSGISVTESLTNSNRTITLVGTAANINTYLDTASNIQYTAASNVNGTAVATISVVANDNLGSGDVNLGTVNIDVTAVNDAPTLSNFGPDSGNVTFAAGSTTFVALDSGTAANAADVEMDAANSYENAQISLVRDGGADTNDRFGFAGGTTALDSGSTVTVGGTDIGSVTGGSAALGWLSITLNASATAALVDTFFQTIGYTNTDGAATGTVTINAIINDRNLSNAQGSGGNQVVTEQVGITFRSAPVIGNLTGDSASFTENGGAVVIDQGSNATVTDSDSPANLNGGNLTVSVTGNANAAQDILGLSTAGTVSLSGTTAGSDVSVGGTVVGTLANNIAEGNDLVVNFNTNATLAHAQTLVQAATYNNSSENPSTGNRTVSFTVTDDLSLTSTAATATVAVNAANDDPTIATLPTDVTVTEDTAGNIDLSTTSFADVDGDNITVTLTASTGTFATPADGAGVGSGVTETLVNSTTITLVGSPADINTYLDTASNIQYTAASNISGNNAATISITANDGNGSGDVSLGTVNVDVTAVNDNPTVATLPASVTVTEDTQSNISLGTTVFADVDSTSITVTLTASAGTFATPADGAGVGSGVTETLQSSTVITLVGSPADINTYLDTASNIQYTPASNVSGNAAATITVTMNDGDGSGNVSAGTVNINVTAVNDNPTVATLPANVTVTEDTQSNIALGTTVFADVDGDNITVTLTASAGTFATPADGAGVGSGVTETLVNSTTITLAGSPADINTYLDTASNIQYTAAANVNGTAAATITVTANDGAGSGDVAMGTVNINVTAVNDDPTVATLPSAVTVTEDTLSNIDLGTAVFGDVDSTSITVTLTASAGTFATPADGAGVGSGVTETLVNSTTITLVGAPADINTYLDTASNIQYTPAANVSGNSAASITVGVSDGVPGSLILNSLVNINVTAVNDVPTVSSLPASVTVTEDTQSNIALGTAVFADVDGDNITVTLIASAGTFAIPADGAGVGSGVVESRPVNNLISLVGSAADINTYLDTASNIQYTPASNVTGNAAASIEVLANDGSGNRTLGTVNIDVTAVNDVPAFTNLDGAPTYIEGGSAQLLDANVTIADVELDALDNYNGASLVLARNGGVNTNDTFSIQTGGNLTVSGSNISSGGNVFATFDTASVSGQVTISFTNANGTTPTTALVNEVMQAIRYSNSGDDPASSAQINWTFSDGNSGNAQGTGDNPGTATGSTTVSITNVNDAPTLTATGGNPTFTEGGTAQDLFNTVSASTIESTDRFTSLTLTVTNVNDGASEILSFDGSDVALTDSNAVTTATNSLSVSVSVTGTTATVSFTGATLTNAQMQTLVDALTYRNSSEAPTTAGNRVVTITSITDNGGTSNSGVATAAPNLTSTVTVGAVNDAPTLTSFGPDAGNVSYVSGSTTFVAFDSGTVANLQDAELDALNSGNGNYNGATVTLVRNGGANTTDRFGIAGGTTALDNGSTVTVGATNIGTVTAGSAASGTITITLNGSATSALVDTFFQSIGYTNTNSAATGTVTIDVTLNDGNTGSQGSGGAQSVTEQINVTIGNIPVIGNLTGDTAAFTEGAGAIVIDQGGDATVTDADSPANLNGGNLSISVTGNANAAQDVLSFSTAGGFVSLSGTTAGSNVSVDVDGGGDSFVVIGTLANNIAAGNTLQVNLNTSATTAHAQALVQAATYNNTSEEPTTGNRTISFVLTDDSGLSSTAATATVSVTSVSDAPTLTATGGNPTYTEGAAASDLFNTVSASTIETVDRFTSLQLTVTNVSDGAAEIISFDGSDVALTNGNAVTTATNSLSVSVAVAGNTATVSFSGATLTNAQMQTLVDGLSYRNTSEAPSVASTRVVTITGIGDSGSTANGGSATAAPNLTSTVTVAAVNDAPSFSNLDATPIYLQSTAAIVLDANATIADVELDNANSYNGATITVVRNGGADNNDLFEGSGNLFGAADNATLTEGGALKVGSTTIGTVTTNSSGTLVLTFNASATSALVDTALQSIAYRADTGQGVGNVQLDWTFSDGTTINQGSGGAQTASGSVTVDVQTKPELTSATYDASTGVLVVTGQGIIANGSGSDIDASLLTLTGEGGATYTLTNTADVNRDSATQFTLTLSAADRAALNLIMNKDGSSSTGTTNYNIAAADNWSTGAPAAADISDASATVTVSGVAAPTITSSTYDTQTGVLEITGTGFLRSAGGGNDIDVSALTITGLGGAGSAHTLTNTADVDVTNGTTARITLSTADRNAVNALLDAAGTSASDSAVYNLAGAEDWARGADASVNIADLVGNSITVSRPAAAPTPTPAAQDQTTVALNLQQQVQQQDDEPIRNTLLDTDSGDTSQGDSGSIDVQTTVGLINNEGRGVTSGDIAADPSSGIDALTIVRDTVVGRSSSGQDADPTANTFGNSFGTSSTASGNNNIPSPPVDISNVLNIFGTPSAPGGEQAPPPSGNTPSAPGNDQPAPENGQPASGNEQSILGSGQPALDDGQAGSGDEQVTPDGQNTEDDEDEANNANTSTPAEGNTQETSSPQGNETESDSNTDETKQESESESNTQGSLNPLPQSFSDQLAQANGQQGELVLQALMFKS